MIVAVDTASQSTIRDDSPPPPVSPEHAARRTSTVMMTIGLTQLLPFGLSVVGAAGPAAERFAEQRGWLAAVAVGGAAYVLAALPVRLGWRPATWLALAACAGQAGVFILLALLAIVAALSAGSPGSMTMGVLLFGSIASLHLFIARWLWPLVRGKAA